MYPPFTAVILSRPMNFQWKVLTDMLLPRPLRWLTGLTITVLILLTAGYLYLANTIRQKLAIADHLPIVAATPPGALIANIPPWRGPQPGTVERPQDTFPFPIPWGTNGPVEPLFAGPLQYPFLCQSVDSGLGQSLVDNQAGYGVPVLTTHPDGSLSEPVIGYSQNCSLPTRLHYFAHTGTGDDGKSLFERSDEQLPTNPTDNNRLLVRVETGTINRFIYVLLMPTTTSDQRDQPDLSRWNGKAVYHFKGAVGIGFQQGEARLLRLLRDMQPALEQGYAVMYSTGTETDYLYNITLQEDTALRVKAQFSARYGKPAYTVGFGDSGGGLQQYLLAQNHPGLIDGGVAIIAYPDMITQVTYGLDCELLEYYFDRLAPDPEFWRDPEHRSRVEGLGYNATAAPATLDYLTDLVSILNGRRPPQRDGATECNRNWRGISANANNPRFNSHFARYSEQVNRDNFWTHWQDNRHAYGTDRYGRALVPTGNTGVQYGLQAWRDGRISTEQFMDINRQIGGWKAQEDMQPEHFWLASQDEGIGGLLRFSPWGEHNMTHNGERVSLAARTPGSVAAARGAWRSGQVFRGEINIPLIDVRPYLDRTPNMHHSWASIASRARILQQQGENRWQSIWVSAPDYKPQWDAFAAMTRWLDARQTGELAEDVIPDWASDRCLDSQGNVIAAGTDVWNGAWNQQADGTCTQTYPLFSGSRQVAGDDARALSLTCPLISVDNAIAAGFYQPLNISPQQRQQLQQIFPTGVCDYRNSGTTQP